MTKVITIQGEKFEVSAPYAEGHVLTAAEARQLNQTRAEGVSNNVRKRVAELLEAGNAAEAQAIVAEYDAKYSFSIPGAGGRTARVVDPVEREALKLAREYVKAQVAAKGRKMSDIHPEFADLPEEEAAAATKEKYDAVIEKVAQDDRILKLAKKNVAEKQKVADSLADDLGV